MNTILLIVLISVLVGVAMGAAGFFVGRKMGKDNATTEIESSDAYKKCMKLGSGGCYPCPPGMMCTSDFKCVKNTGPVDPSCPSCPKCPTPTPTPPTPTPGGDTKPKCGTGFTNPGTDMHASGVFLPCKPPSKPYMIKVDDGSCKYFCLDAPQPADLAKMTCASGTKSVSLPCEI
jgi:hypothetical protein